MKDLAYLNKYLYKYRYRLLLGVLFISLSNWFGIFPAQVIRISFDLIIENIKLYKLTEGFEIQETSYRIFGNILMGFGLLVLMFALIKGFFMFLMRQMVIVVSRLIEYDLKNELYNHYQQLSLAFYRRNNTGDLMNRATEDVNRVRMYLGPAIMYTLNLIVLFVLVISTMISINPRLTCYALLPMPFLGISIYYVTNIINRKSELIQEQLSALSTFVQEAFSGIRVIKAYVREAQTKEDFAIESELYKKRSLDLVQVQSLFYPLMLLLVGLSTLLTVYIGGKEVIKGNISPGNIAEFIVYVNMLTWPVTSVGWVTSLVQRAAASQKRINEFLQTKPEIISANGAHRELTGMIEFQHVTFIYPDTGIRALDNVSFNIMPGEFFAILGRTGSGKSTIANLLCRMYDCTEGRILIDGIDIRDWNLHSLRQQIGFVPQEVFLFSDTIGGNIAFGSEETDEKTIIEAARNAALYENVIGFPEGFNTRIGERGITLSGGQKQRLSIARALVKNPRLLLFDDCLSAVDTKTEEEILERIGMFLKNRSSIIISHRVSTIKNAHQILVLDRGRVMESGKHMDLMNKNGYYKQLFEKQLLEEQQKLI